MQIFAKYATMFRESFNLCAFPWFYSEVCIRPHIRRSTRSLCRYITQKPLLPILSPTIMKIRTERIATSHKVFDGRLLTPELLSNRLETDNYVRTLSLRNSSNTARIDDIRHWQFKLHHNPDKLQHEQLPWCSQLWQWT